MVIVDERSRCTHTLCLITMRTRISRDCAEWALVLHYKCHKYVRQKGSKGTVTKEDGDEER